MSITTVLALGTGTAFAIGLAVVRYLRRPLETVLVELCGKQERARFWAAFSAVALGVTPVVFALAARPQVGRNAPALFEFADQVEWGLIGLLCTLLMLGWMIGRSIKRWEKAGTKSVTVQASETQTEVTGAR